MDQLLQPHWKVFVGKVASDCIAILNAEPSYDDLQMPAMSTTACKRAAEGPLPGLLLPDRWHLKCRSISMQSRHPH